MITTVVFDLDDTLYDEIDYCISGFNAVAENLSNKPEMPMKELIFEALWKQFTSGNRKTIFDDALSELGIDITADKSELIPNLVELYRNHEPNLTLPEESKEVLNILSQNYTLALLTDGYLPGQQLKVRALGIESYFKSIVYTEQLGRQFWKPAPEGFEKIINDLNVNPQFCVYVGDNEKKDFIAPNKLGFSTVKIFREHGIHRKETDDLMSKPDIIIKKLTELPELLEKL